MPLRRSSAVLLSILSFLFVSLPATRALRAEEPVDLAVVGRIRDEGFRRSQVMETVWNLTDRIGPRLTGSPALRKANDWALQQFAAWGLANGHLEPFPFGRGWSLNRSSVTLVQPRIQPLLAYPKAWTLGTRGPVRGEAMALKVESAKDLDEHKGKLAGKIVFIDDKVDYAEKVDADPERLSREALDDLSQYGIPPERDPARFRGFAERYQRRLALTERFKAEKVLAIVDVSSRRDGILRVTSNGGFGADDPEGVPNLTMAAEHYNSILRLLDKGEKVELEIDVDADFNDAPTANNTVAEIPGSDKADQVVMAGAHLDSWHAGSGATDNAAGCAVVMEAVRILKAIGVQPRRTIRAVLWAGEEQGLLGSKRYVTEHFASRPETTDADDLKLPEMFRPDTWPITPKPEHAKLSAYFNLDNGTGKIRGIWAEENAAIAPIFKAWLEPFHDLGAATVSARHSGGTDHNAFDAVGLPGFQFVQDEIEYTPKTHHTNLDTYDHLRREDLMQASVVMASFLYNAAMREELLPREEMPREPPSRKKPADQAAASKPAKPGA